MLVSLEDMFREKYGLESEAWRDPDGPATLDRGALALGSCGLMVLAAAVWVLGIYCRWWREPPSFPHP